MENKETYPLVSIIIGTYNRADLIIETVNSVRNQTYSNWELIIIDDGSEDNTAELIEGLNDSRTHFFKAGRIGIGGKIKNIGLARSQGELIAFNDSDDLWAPDKLEKQVAAMIDFPDAGFCLTGGYNFWNRLEPINNFYKQSTGTRHGNLFNDCFNSQVAAFTQALMVRKGAVAVTGKFKEEKSFSDVEFIYNLAYNFKGVILYEPLVFRRLHDTNYITPNWEKSYYEGITLIKSYRAKLPAKTWRNALFRSYTNFGEKCLLYKKRSKALVQYVRAWFYKPFSIIPMKKIAKTILYTLVGK